MMRKCIRGIIKFIVRRISKINIVGLEKIPRKGGCIVASNHLGRLDVALVYTVLPRDDIILIVAEKYQKSAFFRWIAKTLDAIFVDRYRSDFKTLRQVLRRLERGEILGIAPEGTRSKTESLLPGQPGTAYLASKTGVPVLPAAITGTEDRVVKQMLRRFRRAEVTVRIGDPFTLPQLPRKNRDQILQDYTDEIMCRIAALLPERYRGVYAQNPRLQEILNG